MKKHIIIAAALVLICLSKLSAQDNVSVDSNVTRTFEAKFPGASNIRWETHGKGISLVKFRFENETWIAYYNPEGALITQGRKIETLQQLPINVKGALEGIQDKYASKYGTFSLGSVFEMTDGGGTSYYIPLENAQVSMMVSIRDDGSSVIERKQKHDSPVATSTSVIAKKN